MTSQAYSYCAYSNLIQEMLQLVNKMGSMFPVFFNSFKSNNMFEVKFLDLMCAICVII